MSNPNATLDTLIEKMDNIKATENVDIKTKGTRNKDFLDASVVSVVNGLLARDSLTPQQVDLLKALLPYTR